METKLDLRVVCPECGSTSIVKDAETSELACSRCGFVLEGQSMDQKLDWSFQPTKDGLSRRRTGPPTRFSQSDKGLSTVMRLDRDASGRPLPAETRQQMWRLRKWNTRYQMNQKERNLNQAMNELKRMSEILSIPSSVQDTAALIYRKALDADIVRGRSIPAVVAASVNAACRITETPKTLKEIVAASHRSRKEVARCYRLTLQILEVKVPIHDPTEYISKIAEEAKVPGDVQGLAFKILFEAKQKQVTTSKDPMGIAAAALYIAGKLSHKKTSQKEISHAANTTEVTIRNRKNDLIEKLNIKI